jgi:hypothetical protein
MTNDEFTCLEICGQGEMLAPIGRWEAPVKALAARKLLVAHDAFNYGITDAGREALEAHGKEEDAILAAYIEKSNKAATGLEAARRELNKCATVLAAAAKASAAINGDAPEVAARLWGKAIIDQAIQILKDSCREAVPGSD